MKLFQILVLAAFGLGTATAQAGVIDFTDGAWSAASGEQTHSDGGVTANVLAPEHGKLSYDASDGLGVDSTCVWDGLSGCFDQEDEIDFHEILEIDLGGSFFVEGFTVSNLFDESFLFEYSEHGKYSIDGGDTWIGFTSVDETGLRDVAVGAMTDTIRFGAVRFALVASHEYTLKNITVSQVPEPVSLTLFGAGLLGMGIAARRRRRA